MPLSSVTKQTEQVLKEVLQFVQLDYEDRYPVLCKTDRIKFVEEGERYAGIFI